MMDKIFWAGVVIGMFAQCYLPKICPYTLRITLIDGRWRFNVVRNEE